jgi:UDP-N-acetylmuramate dehydrogenase
MTSFCMQENRLLSEVCTLGIGGPALYFAEIHNINELQSAIRFSKQKGVPYIILGKGSNCLFDDRGFAGMVILNKIDFFKFISDNAFHVGAGYSFSLLGTQTARKGLSGLEFASGIPGTVGGAIYMNAGANGRETCETLVSIEFLSEENLITLQAKDLSFSYRTSLFQSLPGAIVGATFRLTPSSTARSSQMEIIAYRKKTQPYNEMSAGCFFRNPDCGHAGALIDKSGLKGTQIGGAKVSEIHANFIVNTAQATCKDVLTLINVIKQTVKDKTGIELESEVRYIPYKP